ncbi:Ribbon-helix-helix protein, copG family [Kytococcus aerolatus]|uniref:Ribbon-helix-helix protein, copG family n=2 Tax=Kytococcus aerolatus TaxID=592308 RepID=A0A212U7N3_9MICO|nr:Ribbon-helix-helix protein, copG family [Kytococcus aerolatus]
MTLRTDAELDAALTELAEAEGRSRQEVVRLAILDRAARHRSGNQVAESVERLRSEWREVLDRLGSV